MDLTPRPADPVATPRRRGARRWAPLVVLGLVLVAGGVIVTQFLTSAVDYYCNVDEIGDRDGCEEGRRVRIQGTVDAGSVSSQEGRTAFTMSFGGATVPVRYDGEPGGIFRECVGVVVHGELVNGTLEGDRLEVRHSNEYEAENAERLADDRAESESTTCEPSA